MGDPEDSRYILWCNPDTRAVIPVGKLHISRSLKKECLKRNLNFSVDRCFKKIILKCADRNETWITPPIIQNYVALNSIGYAHSIEIWDKTTLLGGLYGVSIGAAFFAESMFSESRNGSKFAMVALMFILVKNNFLLLDVQFMTKHLRTMGAKELTKTEFLYELEKAKSRPANFQKSKLTDINAELLDTIHY